MAELKKCPFCGGEAKLNYVGTCIPLYFISCEECGCKQESSIHKEAVINAWNNRATEAEIRATAKRELAEQIEKRIKEEVALLEQEREEAREYDDEQVIFAVNNQLRAFAYSLRVVAEQLKGE